MASSSDGDLALLDKMRCRHVWAPPVLRARSPWHPPDRFVSPWPGSSCAHRARVLVCAAGKKEMTGLGESR